MGRKDTDKIITNDFPRREFIKNASLATLGTLLGGKIVFAESFPKGLIPKALLLEESPFTISEKNKGLIVLNDRPINAETPPHLLDPNVTPNDVMFVRNNGIPPVEVNSTKWTLTIEGESAEQTKTYTIEDLKSKFEEYTYQLTLECGGNGRSEFTPPAKGNQWTTGAVACPNWTGVKLKDVLKDVGIKSNAVYIGYYGKDTHLSGDPTKVVISRGVPIEKAMEDEALIAWSMNGEEIPYMNGAPLRLVIGGWPASTSGKWLTKIVIRDRVHDGPKMGGKSYRIPKTGAIVKANQQFEVRGHAWAGDLEVKAVDVSIDFGSSWISCSLTTPVNRLAWQHFSAKITLPEKGYYEIWARASDIQGKSQPMVLPGWNPKGYLNNACHRIAIKRL